MDCPAVFEQPAPYQVGYSFSNYQAYNPAKPLPAPRLDAELAAIATALGGVICALRRLQRSDGALANGLVTFDSLSPDLVSRFGLPTPIAAVNVAQFKHALALVGQVGTVANAISADQNDLANIEWTTGGVVAPGDPLATLVQATLGYSAIQMTALFARAARLTTLLPAGGDVTVTQLKRALAVSSQVATVDANVPADPNNLVNIQWTSGGTTGVGDPLASFVETTLNLGIAGITTLYQLAAQQNP